MSKIGRNDLCHCGSGKKYKNCHLKIDEQESVQGGYVWPDDRTFQSVCKNFTVYPIIKMIGVLQLQPGNHGYNEVFEELERYALLNGKKVDSPPYALYPTVSSLIKAAGEAVSLDDPINAFTECAVFSEGDYIVYPGLTLNGTEILNQLLECLFIGSNNYPEAFKKAVHSASNLLLLMSTTAAHSMSHSRYMYEEMADEIIIPERDTLVEQLSSITFTHDEIDRLCQKFGFDKEVIDNFIANIGDPALENENPDENLVLLRPLIEFHGEYILYMPTTVVCSLIEYAKRLAKESNCFDHLMTHFNEQQFKKACDALEYMGWEVANIRMPGDENEKPISEMVFRIDNEKFGYLCFIHQGSKDGFDLAERNREVVSFLQSISKEQKLKVLSIFILAETGDDYFGPAPKGDDDNLTLMFRFGELCALAYSDETDILTLWKFAKIYKYTTSKLRILSMGGMLDTYAIYTSNHESLLYSDKENPMGGLMVMAAGSANDYIRAAQRKRDEHSVSIFINGTVGYVKVIRFKEYAPIYKLKERHTDHRLVIETYKMPIWVTNYQAKEEGGASFARDVCEAIAFWLHQMRSYLESHINRLSYVQFEIEVIFDEELLKAEEYVITEVDETKIDIKIEINAPRIRMYIPFDFIYLVRRPDNMADRLLVKSALEGIVRYVKESGKGLELDAKAISSIIEKVVQPAGAKMMLFSDSTQNVRMDQRNLPSLRYLQEADISYILDNLVEWLQPENEIPEKILDPKNKIALCDKIVTTLLSRLSEKIIEFDGEDVIKWLIRHNEKCVQLRELNYILIPARLACFSSFTAEVKRLKEKEQDLVGTAHAIRTLIEFIASKVPSGLKWANNDDIDELLAITSQITAWGTLSEVMRLEIANPEMGMLPSGRIGSDKTWERERLDSYSSARVESDVIEYVEKFDFKYTGTRRNGKAAAKINNEGLDEAFFEEFGISLTDLSQVVGALLRKGYESGSACVILLEAELINVVQKEFAGMTREVIAQGLNLMTLLPRPKLGEPPKGFTGQDIFPWRYSRQLAYLRRPLVAINRNSETFYYYGYRHLDMYFDNLHFLLGTGKLPETTSEKMDKWIGTILGERGKPFRNTVRDWFKENSDFEVIDYEVKIKPSGHIPAEKDYGDIDLLVIDHQNLTFYSLECKNGVGARNVHEMKVELDLYLGREGNENKAKIAKHVRRDKWLKEHMSSLTKFAGEPSKYRIVSAIITSEEMALAHLAKDRLLLPVISFIKLKHEGPDILGKMTV